MSNTLKKKFPFFKQQDQMDCGASCLRMIIKYYGQNISINKIRRLSQSTRAGVNMLGISEAAEKMGFRSNGVRLQIEQLREIQLPCILHWNQNHFVVLYAIKDQNYFIADPNYGLVTMNEKEFAKCWFAQKELHKGLSLILSPTPNFYELENEKPKHSLEWSKIFQYFFVYKKLFLQLFLGLLLGTIVQLLAPFLTQSIVDIGINTKNINFINTILIAQLMLFIGQTSVSFIRSWIMLHISTRVNISILTDMLIKIMRLPMSFFDLKTDGDIMQRMSDQQRVESFLTGSSINTLFSMVNFLVFGSVLIIYSKTIFFVFLVSTILDVLWIWFFMKYRRELDYRLFNISSENQTYMVELIHSVRDIKLSNSEKQKRWVWEKLQAKMFKFNIKNLTVSQYQQIGSIAISQVQAILISYLSAKAVIANEITFGSMMAIQYLVGMVGGPVQQLLGFMQSYQSAKIGLERINEIYETEDEESPEKEYFNELPKNKTIEIKDLNFTYFGAGNEPVFENLNLSFPEGKTTAIVGMSGSGKTTLLKLLMRYYKLDKGEILVGGKNLDQMEYQIWRESCGIVMQEGFVFSDTIENNIAIGDEFPEKQRIDEAIRIANLEDFILEQPFGINTKIGAAGKGISQGQKQRLLIARAVYKNPQFILLDEATNSLDANNEKIIIDNLNSFLKNRTVVIVAHRLSTVCNADNIIVLEKGKIVEQGTHQELTDKKGNYFTLVKNQLELGN
ncbi:peptidase domain-containing ABC transporter [Pedobacter suwonensis]|uniref:peptidase domain-containing ABC transporter n=1 Tax=Pedobacter suwonensis TaxID=332999 RepID=UPI0011A8149C|nr:peptidase domain-containing ABC transporter [Pedobacter suwonensis]